MTIYLKEVLFFTQVFFNFFVQMIQTPLDLFARIFLDNFSQFLFAERHLIADFRLFHALSDFGLNTFEEELKSNKGNTPLNNEVIEKYLGENRLEGGI